MPGIPSGGGASRRPTARRCSKVVRFTLLLLWCVLWGVAAFVGAALGILFAELERRDKKRDKDVDDR